jgi:ParD-like antitoxin of type II bacterial toxin-antitoxin system
MQFVSTVAKCYPCGMSQPVKLSDQLVLDARMTAEVANRSIAGQIEFWAQLGRAIEPLLDGARALALRRAGNAMTLTECLATIDTPVGHRRVAEYLDSRPFPHYEPAPNAPGLLVRIDADGTRTLGRFVGRQFQAAR